MADIFEDRFFKMSRRCISLVGLWPYDDASFDKSFRRVSIALVYLIFAEVQLAKFFTTRFTFDIFLDTITAILMELLILAKCSIFWFNGEMLKQLLERVKHDWDAVRGREELIIMRKYTKYYRMFGILYTYFYSCGIGLFVTATLLPIVMCRIQPRNESHVHTIPFQGEYFFDQEKNMVFIILHMILTVTITHCIAVMTDMILLVLTMHACALFAVVGHRFERLFDNAPGYAATKDALANWNCRFDERQDYCIEYHLRTMKFTKDIQQLGANSYLAQLILSVLAIVALLYRLFDKLMPLKSVNEVVIPLFHVWAFLVVVFLNIYPAQMVMDTSEVIFYQAYYGSWYAAPTRAQKLLLLVLQKCMVPCSLSAAKIVTASLQIYATIVQTSVSYFSVLYALKE